MIYQLSPKNKLIYINIILILYTIKKGKERETKDREKDLKYTQVHSDIENFYRNSRFSLTILAFIKEQAIRMRVLNYGYLSFNRRKTTI